MLKKLKVLFITIVCSTNLYASDLTINCSIGKNSPNPTQDYVGSITLNEQETGAFFVINEKQTVDVYQGISFQDLALRNDLKSKTVYFLSRNYNDNEELTGDLLLMLGNFKTETYRAFEDIEWQSMNLFKDSTVLSIDLVQNLQFSCNK